MTAANKRRPEVALRRVKALKLRQAGASYADIANTLGLSSEAAARVEVSRAMSSVVREAGEEVVALERDRLDRLQVLAWRLAERGSTAAIRECVRILERRAKLLGLDATGQRDDDGLEDAKGLVGELHARLTIAYEAGDLDAPRADD